MTSPNLSEIITTTLRNRKGEIADNVSNNNALLSRLTEKGKKTVVNGGRSLVAELDYAENATFQRYSGYQTLNVNASDVLSAAEFDPVQAAVNVTISGREQRMNAESEQRMINLLKSRITNAIRTLSNNISNDVYSAGTLDNQIGGLQLLIADDPTTSSTVGGINQSSFSFWRNQVFDFTDESLTSAANMLQGMNNLYLQCTRGRDKPDLIVFDQDYYDKYERILQAEQRYSSEREAVKGFESLKYKGADVIYDGDSGILASHGYFINTDYLEFQCYKGADMEVAPEKASVNQDATVVPILFMGNLTVSNRDLQGVLKD